MAQFVINVSRFDPYKVYKFRVKWENKYVAGLHKCTGLKSSTENIDWSTGWDPPSRTNWGTLRGRTSYSPVTLEAGITHDDTFEQWANQVNNFQGDPAMSLKEYRKNVSIELMNEEEQPVLGWILHRAWVSEFQALPDLDAGAHAVGITLIKFEYEGFERDPSLVEPQEH